MGCMKALNRHFWPALRGGLALIVGVAYLQLMLPHAHDGKREGHAAVSSALPHPHSHTHEGQPDESRSGEGADESHHHHEASAHSDSHFRHRSARAAEPGPLPVAALVATVTMDGHRPCPEPVPDLRESPPPPMTLRVATSRAPPLAG